MGSLFFSATAYYRSKNIFIKARERDVREILTSNIEKYEKSVRARLIGKYVLSIILLFFSIDRIRVGFIYTSPVDMCMWLIFSVIFLIVTYKDYSMASPENHI